MILTFAMGHEQLPPSYAFAARPALDRLEAELPREGLTDAARRLQPRPWKSSSGRHASLSDSRPEVELTGQLSNPPRELNLLLGHVARRQRTVSPQI